MAKRHFIDSAQALIRIEHPNVEALLDFGATAEGRPYHVTREAEVDLAGLLEDEGGLAWGRARGIMLDVIAGVAALHRRRIVHGGISPQAVALFDETARLVEFADASLYEHELTLKQRSADVRDLAALAVSMLTGVGPLGPALAALRQVQVPAAARAVLLRALSEPETVELSSLRRAFAGESLGRARARLIDLGASAAAVMMLSIGLWSSVAGSERSLDADTLAERAAVELLCEASGLVSEAPARSIPRPLERELPPARAEAPAVQPEAAEPEAAEPAEPEEPEPELELDEAQPTRRFASAHARVAVGSEAQRKPVVAKTQRFDLRGEISPASLVERGIDLTHGRPTAEDDPRLPILDGPARARELFEVACARDHGKGCHMLGVQIAEGMVPDDGAGPAAHYRRGCELDYHRSCAALADLARAGEIVADADSLDEKACRLAGAGSSYCRPHS
ncbi:MAG: hypothetical protein R6X02_11260 [Enhygromyxa sp.]